MKKTNYKITKERFLNWFFNTGADQDQDKMRVDIGYTAVEHLLDRNSFTITTEDVFDGCELSCVPLRYCEENEHSDTDLELGELEENWTLQLID
jgi:hypothetical protein